MRARARTHTHTPPTGWYRLDVLTLAPSSRLELQLQAPGAPGLDSLPAPIVPFDATLQLDRNPLGSDPPAQGAGSSSSSSTSSSSGPSAGLAAGSSAQPSDPAANLVPHEDAAFPFPGLQLTPGYTITYSGLPTLAPPSAPGTAASSVLGNGAPALGQSAGSGAGWGVASFGNATLVPDLAFGPGALLSALFPRSSGGAAFQGAAGEARTLLRVPSWARTGGVMFAVGGL